MTSNTSAWKYRSGIAAFQVGGSCCTSPTGLLPLTVGYTPDVDGSISRTADTLRVTLGHRPPTMEDSVQLLVSQGRTIDAVKLVRESAGLSLTEAKRRVEQILESQ